MRSCDQQLTTALLPLLHSTRTNCYIELNLFRLKVATDCVYRFNELSLLLNNKPNKAYCSAKNLMVIGLLLCRLIRFILRNPKVDAALPICSSNGFSTFSMFSPISRQKL